MNIKYIVIGITFILIGVWSYTALSTFKVVEGSNPKTLIIKEGVIKTETEVAKALSDEMGFDLEGAYKTGFTPMDVIEYLIKEPHKYPVTYHDGKFYESRKTVWYIFPLLFCILSVIFGAGLILFKGRSKKS